MSELRPRKYYDNGESGRCCWAFADAVSEGAIHHEGTEDGHGFFMLRGPETVGPDFEEKVYCCPFCGSRDFHSNPRMEAQRNGIPFRDLGIGVHFERIGDGPGDEWAKISATEAKYVSGVEEEEVHPDEIVMTLDNP